MSTQEITEASGYWFPDDDATQRGVAVLNALRRYRAAETAMRRRTRDSMGMGETDLLAVRYLLQAQRAGRIVKPKDLAAYLKISSASTTILIDRLVKSNHVRRDPHPTDRRAVLVELTPSATVAMSAMQKEHAQLNRTLLNAVAPADRAALERGVAAIADRLDTLVNSATPASDPEDGTP